MRWGLIVMFLSSSLWAMTPVLNNYDDPQNVFVEFRNVFDNAQDKSFEIVSSTPNYQDLFDGQMVIYKSSANAVNVNLMLRAGTTMYVSPNFGIIKGRWYR